MFPLHPAFRYQNNAAFSPSGVAAYVGPGDVVSGASVYCGVRAYNSAYAGNVLGLVDQAGANSTTIGLSNHRLDLVSIAAWVLANTVTTIRIAKLYDQTGNNNHFETSTLADMPELAPNVLSTYPVIRFAAQAGVPSTSPGPVQPNSVSMVSSRTGNFSGNGTVLGVVGNGTYQTGYGNSANKVFSYTNGPDVDLATATDNTFHALLWSFNNPTGNTYVDASATSMVNIADGNLSGVNMLLGSSGDGNKFTGDLTEVIVYASALSGTDATNLSSNQHGTSGFNF